MLRLIRDEQGIAMTEGVIVMPFFIIVFMALIALHHIYEGRLEAQVNSAAKAFLSARGGCDHDPGAIKNNDEDPVADEEAAKFRDSLDENGRDAMDSAAGDSPLKGAHTTGAETVVVDDIPALFGGPNVNVSASQKVLCNMKPANNALEGIIDIIKDAADWN